MRNLKRALSLALASVMLLGMMVMGTSAVSYPDVDEADNLEAIEVLKAVGIMEGDTDGNFNPDGMVTRHEMAVIMCNLLGLVPGGVCVFDDVPAWAQPYVAVVNANGIADGIGNNKFNGDANVTAVEAGLMVMKALGYFTQQGEFGDSWKLSVVRRATKIDLYHGISAYTDQNMTRNEIAQMVLNALQTPVVVMYEGQNISVSGGGADVNIVNGYEEKFVTDSNLYDYDGVSAKGTLFLCERLYGGDLKKSPTTVDDMGRPAAQWRYKMVNITTAKEPTLTYTTAVKLKDIYSDLGKPGTCQLRSVQSGYNDVITVDGAGVYQVDTDGKYSAINEATGATWGANTWRNSGNKIGGNGALTEVWFDNSTGDTNIVVSNTYLAKCAKDYDAKNDNIRIVNQTGKVTLANATLKGEDFDIKDLKENDYLLYYASNGNVNANNGSMTVRELWLANKVEDVKVSVYAADDYVTAGGTKYGYSWAATKDYAGTHADVSFTLGGDMIKGTDKFSLQNVGYDLILDNYGYVIGVEPHNGGVDMSEYLFVTKVGSNTFVDVQAKVVFMDGTSKTVTVSATKAVGGDMSTGDVTNESGQVGIITASGKIKEGRFYKFTVNKSGDYQLTDLLNQNVYYTNNDGGLTINPEATTGASVIVTKKADSYAKLEDKGATYGAPANDSTVFVAKDTAYIGRQNAPKVKNSDVYILLNDAKTYLLAVYTPSKGISVSKNSEFVYIMRDSALGYGKDENDIQYNVYEAVVDGAKGSRTVYEHVGGGNTEGVSPAGGTWGSVYKVDYDNDGYAVLTTALLNGTDNGDSEGAFAEAGTMSGVADPANVLYYKDGTITFWGYSANSEGTYDLGSDAKIYLIDYTDGRSVTEISRSAINVLDAGVYCAHAVFKSTKDYGIATLYIARYY